jgi:cbb3-type cytochrome oxidase cytochrome c subunit
VIDGQGGSVGPDLTEVGDKPPEHVHFPDGWSQARTALRWHQAHFLDPEAVVPGTRMPKFTLTERQATALGLLALSWRRLSLPPAWIPPRR